MVSKNSPFPLAERLIEEVPVEDLIEVNPKFGDNLEQKFFRPDLNAIRQCLHKAGFASVPQAVVAWCAAGVEMKLTYGGAGEF